MLELFVSDTVSHRFRERMPRNHTTRYVNLRTRFDASDADRPAEANSVLYCWRQADGSESRRAAPRNVEYGKKESRRTVPQTKRFSFYEN